MMSRLALLLVLGIIGCGPTSGGDMDDPDGGGGGGEDLDGDGYSGAQDCDETRTDVNAGATETCNGLDDDCANGVDDPFDMDGDGSASCYGDCDDGNALVRPGALEVCDGIDNDCNSVTSETFDGDGDTYTLCSGDCDDLEALVNPGAVEVLTRTEMDGTVVAEGVDNDCDGLVDEPLEPCDSGLVAGAVGDYAKAIELCANVTDAVWSGPSNPQAHDILVEYGNTYVPNYGTSFMVLSSGVAADADDPDYYNPNSGMDFGNSSAHPAPMPDPADGCGSADPSTVNDYTEYRLTIAVPSNARSFSYDFNFMSAEYPEWVCSAYDDTFLAILDSTEFDGNISFDAMGRPVTINIGFFTVCQTGAGCTGDAPLVGTGYEGGSGGGTGWLTTTAPVQGGETITLRFIIFDEGDGILDSVVLIDNFRWEGTPVDAPVTIPRVVP